MRRVVKVGGSLLLRKDLPESLKRWLVAQRPAENIVIVGGGELIDAMRHLDAVRQMEPADAHWRCVQLLSMTFQILCDWFPDWDHVSTPEGFQRGVDFGFSSGKPTLVAVGSFYRREADLQDLPSDWRTTTDAIAAAMGIKANADEVVLLKSCDVEWNGDIESLSRQGVVDEALPEIAGKVNCLRIEKLPTANESSAIY